jgi:thiamine kinase-like enzyme
MISKIIHYEMYASLQDINPALYLEAISEYYLIYESKEVTIEDKEHKGTLGLSFRGEVAGQSVYIKTHKPSVFHQSNLDKEYFFLDRIYRDSLDFKKIQLLIRGIPYSAIIMEELDGYSPCSSFEQGMATLNAFRMTLNMSSSSLEPFRESLAKSGFCFSFLYRKAFFALDFLCRNHWIEKKMKHRLEKTFEVYSSAAFLEQHFCHGDISNKNIMLKDGQPILIDWEDAMLGSPIFDFCYWLTFMDQRKYYPANAFKEFASSNRDVLFFMAVIIVLKSYLSILDGSVSHHKVTIAERLEELYDWA